ncbi:uncharacterized protein LOC143298095 isoform X2 [Babylonia areolata]|uniref:uncharacterized protein LOC143298095 isoform X2 n=1 Tax=Babylonia areolata TaxID=304850 RepID=UPI003FCEF939
MVPLLAALLTLAVGGQGSPFGPKYPVTAAWFRDRFSQQDWNRTLAEFQQLGGDTVLLRAPPIIPRSRQDLMTDPEFAWCGSSNSSTGSSGPRCYDEAVEELGGMGLNVTGFVTYGYEEGFSDDIMLCPQTDRKINSSRVYFRIVLPVGRQFNESKVCDFPKGSEVVVLLTSFAGTDPHALLLTAAARRNMSVFFGLPAAPRPPATARDHAHGDDRGLPRWGSKSGLDDRGSAPVETSLLEAYYAWVYRVLREHEARYGRLLKKGEASGGRLADDQGRAESLYNSTLAGYYSKEEGYLAQMTADCPLVAMYRRLGQLVHARSAHKKLAVAPSLNVNRAQLNGTVGQHVHGFEVIAATGQVDVIAVQEGRGWGRGCYYWPGQEHSVISQVDSTLDRVLRYLNPHLPPNTTFQEAFTASNQQVFAALEASRAALTRGSLTGVAPDLWLSVEAFEYLRDDPCLPVDPGASGLGQMMNRASKGRVDRALSAASVRVQKVAAMAWDPDLTCTTRRYPAASLAAQIRTSARNPLIAGCSFHSPANRSVVVIGYNLEGMGQSFEVNWPARGQRRLSQLYGYYFELDWGVRHKRVPSLEYTQLYDPPSVWTDLDDKGWVRVKVAGGTSACVFEYDFSRYGSTSSHTNHYNAKRRPQVYRRR